MSADRPARRSGDCPQVVVEETGVGADHLKVGLAPEIAIPCGCEPQRTNSTFRLRVATQRDCAATVGRGA